MIERYEGPGPVPAALHDRGSYGARAWDTALGAVKSPLPFKPGGTYAVVVVTEVVEEDFD